jgi:S1-C subfamily serine protease
MYNVSGLKSDARNSVILWVKIKTISTGKLKAIGLSEGIIITKINNEPIETVEELTEKLSGVNRGVLLEIMDETGKRDYRGLGL